MYKTQIANTTVFIAWIKKNPRLCYQNTYPEKFQNRLQISVGFPRLFFKINVNTNVLNIFP